MSSFLSQIQENRRKEATVEAAAPAEEGIDPIESEGSEQEVSEISEELKNKLMGKNNSMKDKLREAEEQREAERQAAEDADEAELEDIANEEAEEEEINAFSIEINGVKLEGQEAITTHIQSLEEKSKSLEEENLEYKTNESTLLKIIDEVPEFETVLAQLAKGRSLRVALIHAGFGPDDFAITDEDEPDAESMVEARYAQKMARENQVKAQKEFEKNSAQSEAVVAEFQKENGLDDKTKEKVIENMAQFIKDSMNGKLSKNTLKIFLDGINHGTDVLRAETQGVIQGRNEKMTIERRKRDGSGVPVIKGGNNIPIEKKSPSKLQGMIRQPASSFLDLLKK